MRFSDAFASTRSVLATRPADVLPVFLAGTGVVAAAQMLPIVGIALTLALLVGSGRIDTFFSTVQSLDLNAADQPPATVDSPVVQRFADAVASLLTVEVVVTLLAAFVGGYVVSLLGRAVVGAGQVHAVVAAIRGDAPVEAGVAGARRDWSRFVFYALARTLLLVLPTVVVGVAFALPGGGVLKALLVLAAVVSWPVATFASYLAFLFVPQAIVIEGEGLLASLAHNARFVRNNPLRTLGYWLLAATVTVGTAMTAVFLQALGVGRVLGVVLAFGVTPALGLLKTGLYLDAPTADPTPAPERGSVRGAFARGVGSLREFVVAEATLVGTALALFGVGLAGGWVATDPYSADLLADAATPADVFGVFPVDVFAQLAANNWLVAIATAYAGLGLGVPAAFNLVFNGAIVGGLTGFVGNPAAVAAFVVPHGIVEVPALAVGGALGLHLGRAVWRYLRGRATGPALAEQVVRAYYVLLGLLPVFVVAAFVEAFVTPWVATALV